jgi:hypothetical protein
MHTTRSIPRHATARAFRAAALAAVVLAGATGCHLGRRGGTQEPPVRLLVSNRGYFDVTIYALASSGSSQLRLGTANGLSDTKISIPPTALRADRTLVLRLHAIGTRGTFTTPMVSVSPGQTARLDIFARADGSLDQSTLYVSNEGADAPAAGAGAAPRN